jgi:hypothetical protein
MNKFKHTFNPELSTLFTQQYQHNVDCHLDSRWMFYQLNQPGNDQHIMPMAYGFVTQALKDAERVYSASIIQDYTVETLASLQVSNIDALSKPNLTQKIEDECIRQTAAIHLTQPCWIENTFQISGCQAVTAAQLMSIYLQLTQKQKGHLGIRRLYQSLLLSEGVKTPALHSYCYSQQADIVSEVFDLATIQLALSRFPRVLMPEILGFTLAYCQMPTLIEICFPDHQLPSPFFKHRHQILEKQVIPLVKCITEYLDLFPRQQQGLWKRIQLGFWLYQLQMQRCRDQFNQQPSLQQTVTKLFPQHQLQKKYEKLSTRALYYYLINADLFPDVLATAHNKAGKCLKLSALFNPLPFKHYSHQQFDAYIENIYQTETGAYQPLQGKPKISKTAYIWGIEQIAPMILIDGVWLQHSLSLKNVSPEICDILFSIYCDEIGNGQLQQNHCYIFRQLLDSLFIRVPPVHTEEFIKHPGFIDSAFDLPVYMLALSCFSTKFLPELLGLNMAIELSGLGKDYMRLVDEWNYWGIDSTIADIHISIDNYATGHTLLAKKAIQLYMDDILNRTGDARMLDRHWRRIYTGYVSLRFVGGRFKLGLPVYYLISKLMGKA